MRSWLFGGSRGSFTEEILCRIKQSQDEDFRRFYLILKPNAFKPIFLNPRLYWSKPLFLQKTLIIHRPGGCTDRQGLIISGSRSERYGSDKEVGQEKKMYGLHESEKQGTLNKYEK
jgi:hypothetical protein